MHAQNCHSVKFLNDNNNNNNNNDISIALFMDLPVPVTRTGDVCSPTVQF